MRAPRRLKWASANQHRRRMVPSAMMLQVIDGACNMSRFAQTLIYALGGAVILGVPALVAGVNYAGNRGMNEDRYAILAVFYWAPAAAVLGALVGGIVGVWRASRAA